MEKWTGRLVGRMHNERIDAKELAAEIGVTPAYISMILNGKRNPPGARERLEQALSSIVARREAEHETKH